MVLFRSCTHTYGGYNGAGSTNPWWRVDLFNEYAVNKVIVSNREDCCSERLNGFQVEINVIVSSCSERHSEHFDLCSFRLGLELNYLE